MTPRVVIVGMGYVGLTTAVCFAKGGVHVTGVEMDGRKAAALGRGEAAIHEEGVPALLKSGLRRRLLRFVSGINDVSRADLLFIAVGTPPQTDGSIDLSQLVAATRQVGAWAERTGARPVVVVKSTAVPGTTAGPVREALGGGLGLCYNPEFLREGKAVEDSLRPDKVVIGSDSQKAGSALRRFYLQVYGKSPPPVIVTTTSNAEMIKYASNAFLSMKVSYANQVARLCAQVPGCDVKVVADAIGLDPRIGRRFLDAGLGFGGSCFTKDVKALRSLAAESGVRLPLVDGTLAVNAGQPLEVVRAATRVLGRVGGKRFALLGLAFKPGTDDMRDAVSLRLVPALERAGAEVVAYDPVANGTAARAIPGLSVAPSAAKCVEGADCAVVVTEWDEFRKLSPAFFKAKMRTPFVYDGRRVYDPAKFRKAGVAYEGVGLGPEAMHIRYIHRAGGSDV